MEPSDKSPLLPININKAPKVKFKPAKSQSKLKQTFVKIGLFFGIGDLPHMSPEETLTLNWWEKWKLKNRFPYKLVTHLLITVLVTALVFVRLQDTAGYTVASKSNLYRVFFPGDFDLAYGFGLEDNIYEVYTISELIGLMNESLNSYYALPQESVDAYRFGPQNNQTEPPYPPLLTVQFYKDGIFSLFNKKDRVSSKDIKTESFYITPSDLGPFSKDYNSVQQYTYSIVTMTLEFPPYYNTHFERGFPIEHSWYVKMLFDFKTRGGRIAISLELTKGIASELSFSDLISLPKIIIDLILIVFCVISAVFNLRGVSSLFLIYQATKRIANKMMMAVKWSDVPFRYKLRFFNMWFFLDLLRNITLIIASTLDIISVVTNGTSSSILNQVTKVFLGLGCMLSWINMMRYLEFEKKYMVLIRALVAGMPTVGRFIVGVVPFFVGYAIFGTLLFAEDSQRFANMDQSSITLIGLQSGDDVQNTLRSTSSSIISRIYFYSFLFIAIYAVANIFIAIIEDAYFTVKDAENRYVVDVTEKEPQAKIRTKGKRKHEKIDEGTDLKHGEELWKTLLELHRAKVQSSTAHLSISPPDDQDSQNSLDLKDADTKSSESDESNKEDDEEEEEDDLMKEISSLIEKEQQEFKKALQKKIQKFLKEKGN